MSGYGAGKRGGVSFVSQGDGSVIGKVLHDDLARAAYFKQFFPSANPFCTDADGVSAPGVAGVNFATFGGGVGRMTASYNMLGTQTLTVPFNDATNGYLKPGLDEAAADGVEYVFGGMNTQHNPMGLVVDGAGQAAFVRLRLHLGTVANAAECALGFRRAEAFQAAIDDYADMAVINLQGGDVFVETILNGGSTVSPDTGINVVDDQIVEFEVQVRNNGQARFFVDGAQVGPAFQFDTTDPLVPFFHWLQVTGGSVLAWHELEVGRLWHVRKDPDFR